MNSGSGPGSQTLDGCSVEFYSKLPPTDEVEVVCGYSPPPARLLELGCGTGRLSDALVSRGYAVTGVDNSVEMLSHVQLAETVHSDIQDLDLGQQFDVVLLPSRVFNTPDKGVRRSFIHAAVRHLSRTGIFLAQVHGPSILQSKVGDGGEGPDYSAVYTACDIQDRLASMTIEYRINEDVWYHSFTTEYLPPEQILAELSDAGMDLVDWLNDNMTWFSARHALGQQPGLGSLS